MHRLQGIGGNKRRIAVKHHDIALEPGQSLAGLRYGVASAKWLRLLDDNDLWINCLRDAANLLAAVPDHQNHLCGVYRAGRLQRMHEQRRTGQFVQNLGQIGLHPRALTCGQNDCCCCHYPLPIGFVRAVLTQMCHVARPGAIKSGVATLQGAGETLPMGPLCAA